MAGARERKRPINFIEVAVTVSPPKREFLRRRKRIFELMDDKSIAIIPTAPVRTRNRDIDYPYRPDSDFFYVTGFPEPEAVAVLAPGRPQGEYLLFCRERDPEREQWDGSRAGLEGACSRYDADDAFPIGDIDDILPGLIENRSRVFHAMGYYSDFDQRVVDWVKRVRHRTRAGGGTPHEFVALDHLIHEQRLFKSKAELRIMREAARISVGAHRRLMEVCKPGMMEYQLEAEFVHECLRNGSRATAYPSIVAGGTNACVLHYVENSEPLKDGDLVLIDAGAEYHCYASDITRTFPVNGRFSPEQAALYEVVLASQYAAIEAVKPGNDWNDPHEAAVKVLTSGLVELGLLKGKLSKLIDKGAYHQFYMHRTGHWMGMDVHDVGDYKIDGAWRVLEPGMVTTVEPGLYISPDDKSVAKKWRGIGIRIEDDVLVTSAGHEVLTDAVAKSIKDVEAAVGRRARSG
jgi:Xaa-Pro aminopeptidase